MSNLAVIYEEEPELDIVRGETIKFVSTYDVFGHDIKGMNGIVVTAETTNGKPLVYIPKIEEWCEPTSDLFERVRPGYVKRKSKAFLKKVKTLEYSYD